MTVTLSLLAGAGAQFFNSSGTPLSGGKIYTYYAGTTTPLATYTTVNGNVNHTNPIILDSAGRVPSGGEIWLQNGIGYKFILADSNDVVIGTYDNIPSSAQAPAANDADSIYYEQGYTVNAGSFVPGKTYRIKSLGNTNFTLIGAAANIVGLHFIATGVGAGTGTAEQSQSVEYKLQQTVSVKDFGAVGDGVTDDTAAIQAAIDASARVYLPAGNYKVKTLNLRRRNPTDPLGMSGTILYGDGPNENGTIITGTAGFDAIRAWGATPPAFDGSCQFEISNLCLFGPSNTQTGLDMYACIDCLIENVWIEGWNYGIKARTTIDINIEGSNRITSNNVGLKIPPYSAAGVAATQNLCANVWTIDLLNVRSNVKCGASIGTAGQWTISNLLAENNDVAVYLLQDINYFVIDNFYVETSRTPTVPNRKGVNQLWAVYMGRDEDGNTYTGPSQSVTLNNMMTWFDACAFNFQYVNGLTLSPEAGRGTVQLGPGCSNVNSTHIGAESAGNVIPVATGQNMRDLNYRTQGYNFIINGNFNYDNLPRYFTNASAVDLSTQTLNSTTTRVLRVTCPIGQATTTIEFKITVPFSISQIMCLHGIAGDSTFSDVTLSYVDQNGLIRSNASQTTNLTSWHTIQQGYGTVPGETVYYVRVTLTRSTTTGVGYYYIDEIMSFNQNNPVVQYPSVYDYMAGQVYTGTCTIASGPLFYVEFAPSHVSAGDYYVIASNQQDAGGNVPTIFVEYRAGGEFRVYSNYTNTPVTCLLIPKIMQLTK